MALIFIIDQHVFKIGFIPCKNVSAIQGTVTKKKKKNRQRK